MPDNELQHWGLKGMKWGVRRYQNKDGSLTPAGRKRYADNGRSSGDDSNDKSKSTSEPSKEAVQTQVKRAINSGDIEEVTRWRKDMTNEELKKALERVDLDKKVLSKNSDFVNRSATLRGTKKTARQLTEDELDQALERLKKEQQYVSMASSINEKGRSEASKALRKIGEELVIDYGTKAAKGLTNTTIQASAKKSKKLDSLFKSLGWIP